MNIDARKRFTLRMPEKLYDCLREEAKERGISLNEFILEILWKWIEENGFESSIREK